MNNTTYDNTSFELANKMIGSKLLAYILGVTSTQYINSNNDKLIKTFTHDIRYVTLMEIIEIVGSDNNNFSPVAFQSWMQGMNPYLGDESPARVLRNIRGTNDTRIKELKEAARFFCYM